MMSTGTSKKHRPWNRDTRRRRILPLALRFRRNTSAPELRPARPIYPPSCKHLRSPGMNLRTLPRGTHANQRQYPPSSFNRLRWDDICKEAALTEVERNLFGQRMFLNDDIFEGTAEDLW